MKLDGKQIQTAITQLIDEYKFSPTQILDIVKMGIKSAFRKDYLSGDKKSIFHVSIDRDGNIKAFREYEVVKEVEDDVKEISLKDAKEYKKEIKIGEQLFVDITPEDIEFSRIAVQAAAQTIKQNLKKIERERFYEKFQDKQGELLKARVLKVIGDNVVLDIEGTTVILPPEGQIPNRVYGIGEEILVYLRQISKGTGGIVLDITQSSKDFIEVLLRKIVPELDEEKVEIKKLVRSAGKRTKVLVASEDERIDPVGVFVGQNGHRIMTLLSILDGEKIDFIEFNEDDAKLIKDSLKPARVDHVEIEGKKAIVKVADDQKPIAIGKGAVNIKLANQLTGFKIEID